MRQRIKEIITGTPCIIIGGDIGIDPKARIFTSSECVIVKQTKSGMIQIALKDDSTQVYSVPLRNLYHV